ncbi:CDP-glycerol glycerophosphotransferase family protein [Vagococcus sp. BWB3-3]|uniref:CDP-glycerol glycerophosphotransferase family protein n=1 Tax=Vagococcus allomyrinae TaxID=2794353 RepID=A0A940PCP8_9ENTE|nr:CDP-glycerol glycerophosphotransferase family protein [Vagococcus allomyrinae]MBP1043666.1 CDP-glycerol glycerophosphotransferase family protein [Vagococcus allomyrinae]
MKSKIAHFYSIGRKVLLRVLTYGMFYLLYPLLLLRPIKRNKVVVSNFWGRGYGDNPKYICEYLLNTGKDLDIVWLCKKEVIINQNQLFPKGIRLVKTNSFRALIELHTAKIWMDNCRKNFYPPKRKEQFYIQTWHAGFGLKEIEHDIEALLPKRYVKIAKKDSQMCDLLIFEHSNVFPDIQKTFWYDGEIFREGIPKNDIVVNQNPEVQDKVYQYLNLKPHEHIVLFAPTFKETGELNITEQFLLRLIEAFEQRFQGIYRLVLRLHPNDFEKKEQLFANITTEKVIDGCDFPDMQELLCATEVLITDYSSTIGEMLVSGKRCFLFADDYETYMATKGMKLELTELPFPFAQTEGALVDNVSRFDEEAYRKDVADFISKWDIFESGKASMQIGDRLLEEMGV